MDVVLRRLAPLVLLALVAGAAAQTGGDATPQPERMTSCWNCHYNTAQGDSPPVTTLVHILPPEARGAAPGTPFDYPVQVQNAWTHTVKSLRVTVNLTNAPSLGFASDVPAVDELFEGAIAVDLTDPLGRHAQAVTVAIPDGETSLDVRLAPGGPNDATGADLALEVYPPGYPLDGEPFASIDETGQGGEEAYATDRAGFSQLGYGNWTFVAATRLADAGGGMSLPGPDRTVPFELRVHALAQDTGDRVASLLSRVHFGQGGSATLPFRLFAIAPPGPGESLSLSADLWAHYDHAAAATDDDENATKLHPDAVPVVAEGGQTMVRAQPGPRTTARVVQNGPTLSTASEAVGYATAFLLVASVTTGGMFGKASRRGLNGVFGTAKRRVAFHNFLSYGILLAAAVHTALFVVEVAYHWTLGLLWGGIAVLALLGLGVTGAVQVPLIRAWGYAGWRWAHYGLAVAAVLFTVVHVLLDGAHFTAVQDALGWQDPLDGRALA